MTTAPDAAPATQILLGRRRRVLTDLARIFSTIFNPFLTALGLFAILAHEESKGAGASSFWYLLFGSTFFTSIGPMLYVLWLYATGRIADLDMSIRAERQRVFGIFVIFYALGTVVLFALHAPTLMTATMAGFTAASLVVQFITRSWKISTHALGVTAPLVIFVYVFHEQALPFLILIPIVGWSRVWLKAHTISQVIAGTALGGLSVLVFLRIFRLI